MTARNDDADWMKRALALARRARGDVGHYPLVGAVIVKNGRLIAEGWFKKPGEPHAEVNALRKAGKTARGATLILNLEPCSHFGRTPPCADAVIAAGIKRVVAGMTDPNPLVSGQGFAKLKKAGIAVTAGVRENECRELNRVFVKYITTQTPYVIMKAAATLDGKIATTTGDSRWITGEAARKEVHKLRDTCQAVIVGAGTARRDDPRLTARLAGQGRHPRPVIVAADLALPFTAKVMKTPAPGGPLIFCTKAASPAKIKKFQSAGAEVVVVKKDRKGQVDLVAVMIELGRKKIASLLLEGGSSLFGAMLRAGLVDELILFLAPKLLAADGVSVTGGEGATKIEEALGLSGMKVRRVGEDLMIWGKVVHHKDNR